MSILINQNLAGVGAGTYTTPTLELQNELATRMTFQKTFAAAGGGTSLDTYVQTSVDGGTTWTDAIHFAQDTTTAARAVCGLSAVSTAAAPTAATDGAQTVNTINQGMFGQHWRVKYVVVGAYTSGNLRVDASGVGLETP
jgi:hypothetical protein